MAVKEEFSEDETAVFPSTIKKERFKEVAA